LEQLTLQCLWIEFVQNAINLISPLFQQNINTSFWPKQRTSTLQRSLEFAKLGTFVLSPLVVHSRTVMCLQSSRPRQKTTSPTASNGTRTYSKRSRPRRHETVRRVRRGYFSLGRHMHINETEPSRPLSLLDSSRPIRMDQPRLVVIDRQETIVPGMQHVSRNTQSVSDRSYYFEPGSANETSEERRYPVLSFQPQSLYIPGGTTISTQFLWDCQGSRHNLEDWSYSKQEQVMARFCRWVNRLRRPTFNWDSAILLNVG
ncbi:hypothetical protein AHF37_07518, partial [Paragonimus kellicotti]